MRDSSDRVGDVAVPAAVTPRAVLFLTHALGLTGAAVHMTVLGRELIQRGVRVGVVTRELDENKAFGLPFYKEAGLEIFQAPFAGYGIKWQNVRNTARSIRRVREVVREFAPDLIHVHAPTLCLVARAIGRPYITTFHIGVSGPKKRRIARAANKLVKHPFGRRVIAISRQLAYDLEHGLGIPRQTIRQTTCTVDETRFTPPTPQQRREARSEFNVPDGALAVGMVAVLEQRKNHRLLLDAMRALKQRSAPVVALLAGSGWGTYPHEIQDYAASLDLGRSVRFLGHQPAERVYHASDVFVLPSLQEGFPLSVIEAMLCGLVPIRTPSEGFDEQITNAQTGYIVPFDRPDVLADRLQTLAGDPVLRQRLADAAERTARERFSAFRMADETLQVYREALGR
jgi:glycosyltransferase involved in cell wall biosynthesis